jgi:hypothetical protein
MPADGARGQYRPLLPASETADASAAVAPGRRPPRDCGVTGCRFPACCGAGFNPDPLPVWAGLYIAQRREQGGVGFPVGGPRRLPRCLQILGTRRRDPGVAGTRDPLLASDRPAACRAARDLALAQNRNRSAAEAGDVALRTLPLVRAVSTSLTVIRPRTGPEPANIVVASYATRLYVCRHKGATTGCWMSEAARMFDRTSLGRR